MRENNRFSLCPIASGSQGNSILIRCAGTALLIDAGLSGVELQRRLIQVGQPPEKLDAIIITHEHVDHVKGAGVLSRRFNIPLYISSPTFNACKELGKIESLHFFSCGEQFDIGGITINPFAVSHDACDPCGFTFSHKKKKIGLATDLGIVTNLVKTHLKDCGILYLEANHDPEMLKNGPYPWHLKQRIQSRTGHLSNEDAGRLLAELVHPGLEHVILGHLSQQNNHPEIALSHAGQAINASSISLSVAHQDFPGTHVSIKTPE